MWIYSVLIWVISTVDTPEHMHISVYGKVYSISAMIRVHRILCQLKHTFRLLQFYFPSVYTYLKISNAEKVYSTQAQPTPSPDTQKEHSTWSFWSGTR